MYQRYRGNCPTIFILFITPSKIVKVKKVKLNPGDIIVACTDGLIDSESLRGEPFGKDRVQKSIHENMAYPADKMAKLRLEEQKRQIQRKIEEDKANQELSKVHAMTLELSQ